MRLHLGCTFTFDFPQPTPMTVLLNVHYSRISDLERPDLIATSPAVPLHAYRDGFGNWCTRLTAPPGRFSIGTDGVIRDDGQPDPADWSVVEHDVASLPAETLTYLLGSRYCETDLLMQEAWRLFGATPPGRTRVQAVCDFVHSHIRFGYENSRATRTAAEAYREGAGVCRDFAHLAATFCRCLNIPTRYCTGYISDVGQPPPYPPMDFAAWIECYLGGAWWAFDPRNNTPRIGRVKVADGRDAADVPLTHTFGPNQLLDFQVWIAEAA
ncbi:MAG: transglutaminase family protein [Pseudomonadota bacterium]